MKTFLDTFISTDPDKNSVEQNWLLFKGAIHEALEKYIPKRQIKTSRCIPWITHAIKLKMKERKQLYDRAKKIQTHKSWEAYRIIRNQVTQEISEAHTNYQTQIFENNTCTVSKRFWKYIKSLRKDHVGVPPLTTDGVTTSKSKDKADILNHQFYSVFTDEDLSSIPSPTNSFPIMPTISLNVEGIYRLLNDLDVNKAPGPDKIPNRILKYCATEIAQILQVIFNQSLTSGNLSDDWLTANIMPIFKKGNRSSPLNYRPISLTAVCCKILEHIIYHHIMEHLSQYQIIHNYQHGFRQGYSAESQLITVTEDILYAMDHKLQTDVILLDFQKAFDTVPHQ